MSVAEEVGRPVRAPSAGVASGRQTSPQELDRVLEGLREGARGFARTGVREKARWVRDIARRFHEVAPALVQAACRAKGLPTDGHEAGEEWIAGPGIILRNLRLLASALDDVEQKGAPRLDLRSRDGGGVAVEVLPRDAYDRALFGGFTCEAWMRAELTADDVRARQAWFYREQAPEGGVALVLGAGNVASIPPMDVLYKMFVEGRVCVLKMNPVNEYLGPFFEQAFQELIQRRHFAVVYGGAEVGSYLCSHPAVTEVHITGSETTHDLIVWGPEGPERDERKRRGTPLLTKPITSELGNVSPVLVVPGPYADDEIEAMARNIAGSVVNNASFNCNASKLLITPKGWSGRGRLLGALEAVLSGVPRRPAYYPGAAERYQQLTAGQANVRALGPESAGGTLPWTLVLDLDASAAERHFRMEPFCSVLSETQVGSDDPVEFLAAGTAFANDRLWGTLNAALFVHPRTESDPGVGPAFERALSALRYGAIAVNHWPAMVYGLASPPWGAHPSSTLQDIQSGMGFVHNTLLLDGVEKSVLRGPLKAFPKPVWFTDHRTLYKLGRELAAFEYSPSVLKLPGLALTAMRG